MVETELPLAYVRRQLQREPGWQRSFGIMPGEHWRRPVGDGCEHVRIVADRAWAHFDDWDPQRFPFEHAKEVIGDVFARWGF